MSRNAASLLAMVTGLALQGAALGAVQVHFNLATDGRLQSGSLVIDPVEIDLRYTFAADTPDGDPSTSAGSYALSGPFKLSINGVKTSPEESTTAVGAAFTSLQSYPAGLYTLAVTYPASEAQFFGRDLVTMVFNLIDWDGDMLTSDALPTSPDFAQYADAFYATLTFIPIAGDPNFGTSDYTQFTVCDSSYALPDCVPAPITITRNRVDEPGVLFLWALGALGLLAAARRRRAEVESVAANSRLCCLFCR